MSAVGDARKRTQQTPAGTLTDTESEVLDDALNAWLEQWSTSSAAAVFATVEKIATARVEAAVAAALAPIEAVIAAERCRDVHPDRSVTCRACKSWAAHVAELAGGGDRGPAYVWTRNDQTDHEAGHPSGYDCDGYAIMPPNEVCARVFPAGGGDQ